MSGSTSPASVSETIAVSTSPMLVNVHALLDSYDLAGYVDGSGTAPSPTVSVDGVTSPNADYALWKRQVKLIYSALLGAISVMVQPLLSKAVTAADLWTTLSSTYANPSHGHVQQLRHQLKHWTKGTKTIDAYFQGFTTRFDQLALLEKPVETEAQLEFILEGLPDDYKTLVDQIEGCDTPPLLLELHEKLINFETKLTTKALATSSLPASANVANYRGNSGSNGGRSHGQSNHRGGGQNQSYSRNQYSPRPYQVCCQICGIYGHSARRCSQLHLPSQQSPMNQSSVSSYPP
ncbi:PREDICTED: uncharacterized protein LOC104748799 [Camelina sativa]|uniref:Uncharacterized protein LOC104748799 n=1 Tax=Camelina sativa TaxID=90675 RepID=A0ABM0WBM0_CAMSA|nr:PREDICTED: uncharacterized protein LOC104748799 [Camelina sativa]